MEESSAIGWNFRSMFRLENLPSLFVMLLVFLVPLFFIPSSYISVFFSKSILVFSFITIAFFLFLVSVLKKGRIEIPISRMYLTAIAVPVVILISAMVSRVPEISFMGSGAETGTFMFILLMFMLLFLVVSLFQTEHKVFNSYVLLLGTFGLVSLFHIVRLMFGPTVFSFGIFNSPTSTLLGGWYDLPLFYGMTLILSLVSIELFKAKGSLKILLYVTFFVSLGFIIIINLFLIWIALAILAVIFFVYLFSFEQVSSAGEKRIGPDGEVIYIAKKDGGVRRISVLTLVVLVVSCLFLTPLVSSIGNSINKTFGLSTIEARPSWVSTMEVSRSVLKSDPIFGSGPNTFASQWQLLKPGPVNLTAFWDTGFNQAVGFIPTFIPSTGILGLLAWLGFLIFFLYSGFVSLFARNKTGSVGEYITASSFFTALFLLVILVIYTPSTPIIVLTFFFTGLFFASLHRGGLLRSFNLSFSSFPRASFAMVLCLVFVVIATLSIGYFFAEKALSSYYFSKGVYVVSEKNDINTGESYISNAIGLWPSDTYLRSFSELQIMRLNNIVASVTSDEVSDEVRNEFQKVFGDALDSANLAVAFDSTNFLNWMSLARVYESVSSLGIDQAYENATKAYGEALKRSPQNPRINLMLARLEANKKDFTKSKEYITQALVQKPNYTEAIFLRSQIEVAEGNIRSAVSSMEGIALISPNDPGVFFELGLLNYNDKDYASAAVALKRAVDLLPNYSNAKYFLGLSYDKLNRRVEALAQFEDIAKLNPENAEVVSIIENLKSGRGAFANVEPPADDKPEKREELPVEEN